MRRAFPIFVPAFILTTVLTVFSTLSLGQDSSGQTEKEKVADRNREAGESSSKQTEIDIRPPKDDAKNHPGSEQAVSDLEPDTGVQEFHPWNPMKALKDIEIGDFYFKRKNYKAALERYKEALYYKEGDAVANYRAALCEEKLGDKSAAQTYYQQYLKILPAGQFAKEARESLERLTAHN